MTSTKGDEVQGGALPAEPDRAVVNGAASVSALRASVPSALAACKAFRVPDYFRIERTTRGFVARGGAEFEGMLCDTFAFSTIGELAEFIFAAWDESTQGTEAGTDETERLGPKGDGPVRDSECAQGGDA